MEHSEISKVKKNDKNLSIFSKGNIQLMNKTTGISFCRLAIALAKKRQGNYKSKNRKTQKETNNTQSNCPSIPELVAFQNVPNETFGSTEVRVNESLKVDELIIKTEESEFENEFDNSPSTVDEHMQSQEITPGSLRMPPLVPIKNLAFSGYEVHLDMHNNATPFKVMATDFRSIPPIVPLQNVASPSSVSTNAQENENFKIEKSIIKTEYSEYVYELGDITSIQEAMFKNANPLEVIATHLQSPNAAQTIQSEQTNCTIDNLKIKTELPECEHDIIGIETTTNVCSVAEIKREQNFVLEENQNKGLCFEPIFTDIALNSAEMENKVSYLPEQTQSSYEISFIPQDEHIEVTDKKRPMTAAERARKMRARRRQTKVKKPPMTASERARKMRALRKAAREAIPFEVIAVNSLSSNAANVAIRDSIDGLKQEDRHFDELVIKPENSVYENEFISKKNTVEYENKFDIILTKEKDAMLKNANHLEFIATHSQSSKATQTVRSQQTNCTIDNLKIKTELPHCEHDINGIATSYDLQNKSTANESLEYTKIKSEPNFDLQENQSQGCCFEPVFPESAINSVANEVFCSSDQTLSSFEISFLSQPEHIEVREKKRPMTAAERARKMRARRRQAKVKKPPMTASERVRKMRALRKAAREAIAFECSSLSCSAASVDLQNVGTRDSISGADEENQQDHEMVITPDKFVYENEFNNMTTMETALSSENKQKIENASKQVMEYMSHHVNLAVLKTDIKGESNFDMKAKESETALGICTELFCEPVLSESAFKSAQKNNEILEQTVSYTPTAKKANSKRGEKKSKVMTSAERSRKHRAMKKAQANAIPFDLIALNNESSDVIETVLTQDNAIAKVKVKCPLTSEGRLTLFKRCATIEEYLKSKKPKRRAMTAAERMRLYRKRKKESQKKT